VKRGWIRLGKDDGMNGTAPWTDDYVNILAPLIENLKYHWAKLDINIRKLNPL
jgi:hypothetical protein